jgi:mono/diheme cytochrome c family protein
VDGRAWQIHRVRWMLGLLVVAGCDSGAANGSVDGSQVFANTCAVCHGAHGKPDEGMVARIGVKDLTAIAERAKFVPGFVENQVRNGSKNKLMPGFGGALRDDQITAVAAYVVSPRFVAQH